MESKLLKNKKGDFIGLNIVLHIFEIIFTISLAVFLLLIIHIEKDINTFDLESEIFINRILYSNNGLWLYDKDTGRIYPGIIDIKNFDINDIEKNLEKTMFFGKENNRLAAEIILKLKEKSYSIYYNKEKYDMWVSLYKAGYIKGIGARKGKNKKMPVLVKKGEEMIPAILDITILIPNR